jgi:hypothetical protein
LHVVSFVAVGLAAAYGAETLNTPPVKVMSTVDSSPIVALITGSSARKPPVSVNCGFVALAAADEGFTTMFVAVPTRAANVA